jgi:GNAT superfamily N-acetyltransferase
MDSLNYLPALPSNIDELLALLRRIALWLKGKGLTQWEDFLEEKGRLILEKRFREGKVYKVLHGSALIGIYVVQDDDVFWHQMRKDNLACWVHTMGVDPDHIGRGVGAQILAQIEEMARLAGKKFVRLDCMDDNPKLCTFYESQSFQKVGIQSWKEWQIRLYEKTIG